MAKPDGGPAFPGSGEVFLEGTNGSVLPQSHFGMQGSQGMTLLDWFAGQVIGSILPGKDYHTAAYQAYQVAEAMIKASGRVQ